LFRQISFEEKTMMVKFHPSRLLLAALASVALIGTALAADTKVTLSGAQVVPPVTTDASAEGTLSVGADKSVAGTVKIKGLSPFAAHIHLGESGTNGPPIIFLEKKTDDTWAVVPNAKMTDEQYAAYMAGKLYFQFHTEKYKPGEIRGQIKP
jgi:hypothetical protein